MKIKDVLVIIDLQTDFVDALENQKVINNCKTLIKNSKKNKEYIAVVRMIGCGKNDPRIVQLLKNYKKVIYVNKIDGDGSKEIEKALKRKRFNRLKLCGCYLDQCVLDTSRGLLEKDFKVKILKNACYGYMAESISKKEYERLPKQENLVLVGFRKRKKRNEKKELSQLS